MKEYLRKYGIRLGVIVLAAVLLTVASSRVMSGRVGFFADAAGAIRSPIQKAATGVASWLEGIYGYIYEYDQLKAELESVKKQLADAEERAQNGADAVEENNRFRELLGYLEKNSDFDTESAKIVAWNASNWSSSFTISKGESSGIELGDCVITEYGALVGQVTELGTTFATVSTVVDIDTSVGALVGDDGAAAMAIGDYALMQKGCVKLTYLTEGAQMFMGDTVVTSGAGGIIPQGVSIGVISGIQTEAGGQREYGILTPSADLSMLVQVFIVKDFEVTE